LIVLVVHIKLCDIEVFVDALVVAQHSFDLGKFAMNGGAFGRIRRIAFGGGVAGGSSVRVGGGGVGIVVAGTGAAAGVVAGKFGRRLRGERVLSCGVRGCGCPRTRWAWRVGRSVGGAR
jgi:hypothetical protein